MKIKIENRNIKGKNNSKILHLSDIHFTIGFKEKLFSELIELIHIEKPSYICITGDIIDDVQVIEKKEMEILYYFLEQIGKNSPVLLILGNHDMTRHKRPKSYLYNYNYYARLRQIPGVYLLQNESYEDDYIFVFGFEQSPLLFKKELKQKEETIETLNKALSSIHKTHKTSILLMHSPLVLVGAVDKIHHIKYFDFVLAGHTHGGLTPCFSKKGNRGLISPNKKIFPKNVRGIIKTQPPIVIENGLTKLSKSAGIFHPLNIFFGASVTILQITK